MKTQLNLKPLGFRENPNQQNPVFIAGPCSAETEKQVLDTAQELSRIGVPVFRAGIWKPRTRPGGFQGIGEKALQWLKTVKKETGLLVSTEVANEKHVYQALKHDIDILWLGARTTANPFAVEEIANALEGTDIPVLVKNPINPDLKLWLGALERLNMKGIQKLGAIHRGFSSSQKSIFRNPPQWNIPADLKRAIPTLPVFHDPSHTSGNTSLIPELMCKAQKMQFDGYMIEVHTNPAYAKSDANQQLTPEEFYNLLQKLGFCNNDTKAFSNELDLLRKNIDLLDEELLDILYKRMQLVNRVGAYKNKKKMGVYQVDRWEKLLSSRIQKGNQIGLNSHFIRSLFESIHKESINKQNQTKPIDKHQLCGKLVNK